MSKKNQQISQSINKIGKKPEEESILSQISGGGAEIPIFGIAMGTSVGALAGTVTGCVFRSSNPQKSTNNVAKGAGIGAAAGLCTTASGFGAYKGIKMIKNRNLSKGPLAQEG